MADKKISALNELTSPSSTDILPIVDIDIPETKKITVDNINTYIENNAVYDTLKLNTSYTVLGTEPIGTIFYDSENKTYSYPVENGTIQINQEHHDYYVNLSGGNIINGDVVSSIGASGNRTAITLTDSTNTAKSLSCIGMCTVPTIGNNNTGRITTKGMVKELNTNAFTEGLPVYVDPNNAGKLTQTLPVAPNYCIQVGIVLVKHLTEGIIDVDIKINPKLEDLSDVNGTALTATGQIPVWNNTNKYFDFNYNITNYVLNSSLTFSAGSIPFAGSDGLLTQDNANFSFDDTNNSLKINSTTAKQLRLGYSDSVYCDFTVFSTGNVNITNTGSYIYFGKNISLNGDNRFLYFGTGADMRFSYDGTKGILDSSIVAPSDISINCGTDKTIVLSETVYDDFLPSVSVLATGVNSPDTVNYTIQSVVGSYYSFDGGTTEERLTVKIELLHGYKEGSDIEIHVHAMPSTTGAGDVIWYFDYYKSIINSAPLAGATLSGTSTITANTQYHDYTVSLGTITGTGLKIGDFIIGTLRRTPTGSGDTYGDDMLLKQIAGHCEKDTIGSRQRYIK